MRDNSEDSSNQSTTSGETRSEEVGSTGAGQSRIDGGARGVAEPISIAKGRDAFTEAAERLHQGRASECLTLVATARAGLDILTEQAVTLARHQQASWGDIASALGVSRQAVHNRYGPAEGHPGEVEDPMPAPEAVLEFSTALDVLFGGPVDNPDLCKQIQRYPLEVYRLTNGDQVAIVGDVYTNTSLMNASERVMAAVQRVAPGAHVLELWRHGSISGTPGKRGRYAWSSGTGGNIPAKLDHLARLGLELREER